MSQPVQFYQLNFNLFAADGEIFGEEAIQFIPEQPAENVPRGEHTEGYGNYLLIKEIPETGAIRRYFIAYQPSLWEKYTVQRQWGLVGSEKQQFCTRHFEHPSPALAHLRRLIRRRLRRGYKLAQAA